MRSIVSWVPLEAEHEMEVFLRMLLESAPREEKGRKQEWAEREGRLTGNPQSHWEPQATIRGALWREQRFIAIPTWG